MTLLLFVSLALDPAGAGGWTAQSTRPEALIHYRAGRDAMLSEDFPRAEREFNAAVRLDPTFLLAHYGLGQVHMATRRYPEAVRAFTSCRDAFLEEEQRRLANAGARDQGLSDQIRELEDYLRLLQSRPQQAQTTASQTAIRRIEYQLDDMKNRRQRRDHAEQPVPAWISFALGSAHFRNSSLADAEREYLAALRTRPKLGEAHNNLAVVYMLTGRPQEAQEAIRLAEKNGYKVDPQLKQDVKKLLPPS